MTPSALHFHHFIHSYHFQVTGSVIAECAKSHHIKDCLFDSHTNSTMLDFGADPTPAPAKLALEPYLQAEFAGAFLFSCFMTLSLCMYFFRAHGPRSVYEVI